MVDLGGGARGGAERVDRGRDLVGLGPARGAANARTVFAFGGGQVVDATGDGAKHWWQAFLGQGVIAAVPRLGGGIIAVAQNPIGTGSSAQSVIYVSKDGGHHWHLETSFGT